MMYRLRKRTDHLSSLEVLTREVTFKERVIIASRQQIPPEDDRVLIRIQSVPSRRTQPDGILMFFCAHGTRW